MTQEARDRMVERVPRAPGLTWLLVVVALATAMGCGTDSDYQAAVSANTITAFDDYLRLHPDGAHAADARARLASLVEAREWQRALAAATADSYQQYLRSYPSGVHAHDALMAIADLNLASAPSTDAPAAPGAAPAAGAPTKGPIARAAPVATPAAPAAPVAMTQAPPPAAKRAAPAPSAATHAAPTAAAGVRIQLGAFAQQSGAEAAWRRLSGRYPELASRTPLIAAGKSADGRAVERLQVGGFSRDSATRMCSALAASHDACIVIPDTGAAGN